MASFRWSLNCCFFLVWKLTSSAALFQLSFHKIILKSVACNKTQIKSPDHRPVKGEQRSQDFFKRELKVTVFCTPYLQCPVWQQTSRTPQWASRRRSNPPGYRWPRSSVYLLPEKCPMWHPVPIKHSTHKLCLCADLREWPPPKSPLPTWHQQDAKMHIWRWFLQHAQQSFCNIKRMWS